MKAYPQSSGSSGNAGAHGFRRPQHYHERCQPITDLWAFVGHSIRTGDGDSTNADTLSYAQAMVGRRNRQTVVTADVLPVVKVLNVASKVEATVAIQEVDMQPFNSVQFFG